MPWCRVAGPAQYEGLWMKEPQEFLFDPVARARRYLQKFPAPVVFGSIASNACNLPRRPLEIDSERLVGKGRRTGDDAPARIDDATRTG